MPKLKNILQDLGSAVIPAATTLGAAALTGGMSLGPTAYLAAAGAGARGFARNEEEERLRKMMRLQAEEDRRAQAMANLINALQPGSGARARPSEIAMPKRGLGETIAGGAAQGIQAYQLAKSAQEALEDRKLLRDKAEREAEQAEGAGQAATELAARRREEARIAAQVTPIEGVRKEVIQTQEQARASGDPRLRSNVLTTIGGKDALEAHKRAQAEALRTQPFPGGVLGDLEFQRQFTTPQSGAAAVGYMGVMGEREKERADIDFARRRVEALEEQVRFQGKAAEYNETRLQLMAEEANAKELALISNMSQEAKRNMLKRTDANPLFQTREKNQRFFQDVMEGYALDNALGDLQMLKGLALMQDPTGAVLQQEFVTMTGAVGELEKLGITLDNYLEEIVGGEGGRRLNARAREMFLQNGIIAYENRSVGMERFIDSAITTEHSISGVPIEELRRVMEDVSLPPARDLLADQQLRDIYDSKVLPEVRAAQYGGTLKSLQTNLSALDIDRLQGFLGDESEPEDESTWAEIYASATPWEQRKMLGLDTQPVRSDTLRNLADLPPIQVPRGGFGAQPVRIDTAMTKQPGFGQTYTEDDLKEMMMLQATGGWYGGRSR